MHHQPDDQMLAAIKGGPTTKVLGGYNEMPPNWETITESEFLWRFQQNWKNEFRQIPLPSIGYGEGRESLGSREIFCDVHMWVAPDLSGVGFITHYNGRATRSTEDAFFAQFFKWTHCEHQFETTVSRMSYWEGTCSKCGYHKTIDSSG
jgi:hypothetical protein